MEKYLSAKAETESKLKELNESCNKVSKILEEEWKKIQKGQEDLQAKKDDLAKQNGGSTDVSDSDILDINAGGEIIRVSRGTLTQIKGSRLEALFSGRWEKQLHRGSRKGQLFLDINPACCRCIVDYLNVCAIAPPDKLPSLPQTDSENQVYLDALLTAFGLYDPCQVDSIILMDPKHIGAITGFLQEDNLDSGLTLLYRGTRDGMNAATFHQKCDNQGPTITVVKSSENYILGGFADKPWTGRGHGKWIHSDKAFLFGLFCHEGQEPLKMRLHSSRNECALYYHQDKGPTFGGGHDLTTLGPGGTYSFPTGTYMFPSGKHFFTGSKNFVCSEIEVFKVENCRNQSLPASSVQNQPWHQLTFEDFPDDIKQSFQTQKEALLDASNELQLLQENFEKEQALVDAFCAEDGNDVVVLNVSGRIMAVKHLTLASYPDSVLYKQFVDPNWNGRQNRKRKGMASARDWSKEEVIAWSKTINGLSEDVSSKFEDITGAELLALERDDIKDIGIVRPGTVALVFKAIQKLSREEDEADSSTFIHHSDYCFGKILDHMRLKAMKNLGVPDPGPPIIREADKKNFEFIVEYFFPNGESAGQFLA